MKNIMTSNLWLGFALLSALFAALTSIFAKVGIEGVNSNLATALRTIVVLIMAWGMVFITKSKGGIDAISTKSWLLMRIRQQGQYRFAESSCRTMLFANI